MEQRYNGEHHEDWTRDRDRRSRMPDAPRDRWRDRQEAPGRDDHPGREWEHERSSGSWRGGESFERSPREEEPERYGYGSAYGRGREAQEQRWRTEHQSAPANAPRASYDDRYDWQDGPGELGERSYGGYGDWPGPEYEGVRAGRTGLGGAGYDRYDEQQPRRPSRAQRWGLGRGGMNPGREQWSRRFGASPEETQAGRFAGRGPRGYQRSDERIREDVCDLLLDDPYVDASDIAVSVRSGEVTLEGTVPSRRMKRDAEESIEDVSGVKQVHNQLRVQNDTTGATSSAGRAL